MLDKTKFLDKFEKDMLLFGKVCLPTMFSVKSPQFHRELSDVLSDYSIKKINIIAPRGHAKSSIGACLLPLHHLFFDKGPKLILLVSKTEGHAIRLLQTIKNALDYSIPLRSMVGYWGEHSARIWKSSEVVLKDGTMILCRGTGQMVVGMKHGDQRPTLVILDDPEDMNNTKTAEAMEFNLRWLLQSLVPSLDPQRGRIVIIGTPQHERCMVETIQGTLGWRTLRYKALQDDGTALWPDWWPAEKLLEEKASLESINRVSSFYREYQCQIIGDEDQLFRWEDIQIWDGTFRSIGEYGELTITHLRGEQLSQPDIRAVNVFMGVDPASSTNQTADYSTIVPIAVDKDRNRFVLEYYRKHATPLHLADAILRMAAQYKPKRTRIETVGYQEMLREYLRVECTKRNTYVPGLEIKNNPRTAKSHRIETLEPFFVQKHFFVKESMSELRDELLLYPRGKHDDLLDGLYYANKGCYPPTHEARNLHISQDYFYEEELDWATA